MGISREEMLLLLADNTAGDISAQDMRDIISAVFAKVTTAPTYAEGDSYYHDGVLNVMGESSDVILKVGREMQMIVENNSGAAIPKGRAVRQVNVVAGKIQITLAKADTFDNARILGITTHEIADTQSGVLTTFGEIINLDTAGISEGVPLYLSDTVAGTFTETAPAIISRVGGVTVADAVTGKLFVYIINNKNLPSVFGGMQGQTAGDETYSLTTSAQDIINYETEKEVVVTANPLTGEIALPNDGDYRMHFTAAISFTSVSSTRSVTLELYDVTGAEIHFPYVKNIPRDATEDSLSFSWAMDEVAGRVHKMRIKASTAMDVTFDAISFDIESISIR